MQIKQMSGPKIENIFLSVCFNIWFGCSEEPSLSSTHKMIMFLLRNKKIIF